MKFIKLFLAAVAFLSLSGRGLWATDYTFTFSIGGNSGTGYITTQSDGFDDGLLATGGYIDVTKSNSSIVQGVYNLILMPGLPPYNTGYANGLPGVYWSPNGAFWIDNLVYPDGGAYDGKDNPRSASSGAPGYMTNGSSILTDWGLLFGNLPANEEINLWGNGSTSYAYYAGTAMQTFQVTVPGDNSAGAIQLTATPEPVSMVLMGSFLSLAGGLLSRTKRAR